MTKPLVLLIRDGWGHREDKHMNGVLEGDTSYQDKLLKEYPWTLLKASEDAVGLPNGIFGNSEVGHMTIGSGRITKEALVKINEDIDSGAFYDKDEFQVPFSHVKKNDSTLHIMGLIQTEGVHADLHHIIALVEAAAKHGVEDIALHVFTDGRDAPVKHSIENLRLLEEAVDEIGKGDIKTISGRYYAMDRDHRWERTEKAYNAIIRGDARSYTDPESFLKTCYEDDETDEFIIPSSKEGYSGAQRGDAFIFANFRGDRPRQLTKTIVEPDFDAFETEQLEPPFVMMTEYYDSDYENMHIPYPKDHPKNTFGEVISRAGLKQLRIAESEKYPHVTFFFNGQNDEAFEGEDRIHIPSPDVATYDLQPEMSLYEVTDTLLDEIEQENYDVYIVNFANGDMVGHTGDWDAVLKAVQAVDHNVERVVEKVLEKDGSLFITADHGNCDVMEGKYRTSHTLALVEFIVVSNDEELLEKELREGKGIANIAPTMLHYLGLSVPPQMANVLFKKD